MLTFNEFVIMDSAFDDRKEVGTKTVDEFKKIVYSASFSIVGQSEDTVTFLKNYKHSDTSNPYPISGMYLLNLDDCEFKMIKIQYNSEEGTVYDIWSFNSVDEFKDKIKELKFEDGDKVKMLTDLNGVKDIKETIPFNVLNDIFKEIISDVTNFAKELNS